MPLFESKPKLSIEECCRQFYDSNIFHSKIVAGQDFWSSYLDTAFQSIAEVDQSFLSVDPTLFRNEMTALRMEMFGLAWSRKFKHEEFTIPQSVFTKLYLEENGRLDIWDSMDEYNCTVNYSALANENGVQMGGTQAAKIKRLRFDAGDKWIEANIVNRRAATQEEKDKLTCVIRVLSRIGADIERKDGVTVGLLSGMLAHRLGYDVNPKPEALLRLGAVILGFYKGAEEYLKSVDLHG